MDTQRLLARFENGVVYECGCLERGLHPAVINAVQSGHISALGLLRCPVHRAPMRADPGATRPQRELVLAAVTRADASS